MAQQKLQPAQIVNRVGSYLYKHLDGAYKYQKSGNTFDIYTTVLYQIPYLQRIPGRGREYNDVHEMTLLITLTTYANKVRVNVIEETPERKTLGFDVYEAEKLQDTEKAAELIYSRVQRRIIREFKDYDFLF